jgi:hypothetical protein
VSTDVRRQRELSVGEGTRPTPSSENNARLAVAALPAGLTGQTVPVIDVWPLVQHGDAETRLLAQLYSSKDAGRASTDDHDVIAVLTQILLQ